MIQPLTRSVLPPAGVTAEVQDPYRDLLHRLGVLGGLRAGMPAALGVTSCESGEGVSTVASALVRTFAGLGQGAVLLIDANLEHPQAHQIFGVKLAPGLADTLADPTLQPVYQRSSVPELFVLAAGAAKGMLARGWTEQSFAEMFQALKQEFALVVVDLPPVAQLGFAAPLAEHLDGVLLVMESERVSRDVARRTKDLLGQTGARLLGAVLNKKRQHIPARLERFL
jgi:capsular exopolysaccharide synthesis family protein